MGGTDPGHARVLGSARVRGDRLFRSSRTNIRTPGPAQRSAPEQSLDERLMLGGSGGRGDGRGPARAERQSGASRGRSVWSWEDPHLCLVASASQFGVATEERRVERFSQREVAGVVAGVLVAQKPAAIRQRVDHTPSARPSSTSLSGGASDEHLGDDSVRGRPTRPVASLEPGDDFGVRRASGDPGQLAFDKGGERLALGRGALLERLGDLVRDIAEVESSHVGPWTVGPEVAGVPRPARRCLERCS